MGEPCVAGAGSGHIRHCFGRNQGLYASPTSGWFFYGRRVNHDCGRAGQGGPMEVLFRNSRAESGDPSQLQGCFAV